MAKEQKKKKESGSIYDNYKLSDVQTRGAAGPRFELGTHVVKLVSWTAFVSRKRETNVGVRFKVIESDNPKHKKGSYIDTLFNLDDADGLGLSRIKNLLIALAGWDASEDEEKIEEVDDSDWVDMLKEGDAKGYNGVSVIAVVTPYTTKAGRELLKRDPSAREDAGFAKFETTVVSYQRIEESDE